MLREFQDEIARLKARLQGKGTSTSGEWQGALGVPSRHRLASNDGRGPIRTA